MGRAGNLSVRRSRRWGIISAGALAGLVLGLWPTDGSAGQLELKEGAIVLPHKGLSEKRTIWAKGNKLIIVWQKSKLKGEVLETPKHHLIESARIRIRSNRTELELSLREKAEKVIARVAIRVDADKLTVKIRQPGAPAPTVAAKGTTTLGKQKIDLDSIPEVAAPSEKPLAVVASAPYAMKPDKGQQPWKVRSKAKASPAQPRVIPANDGQDRETSKEYAMFFGGLALFIGGALLWWKRRRSVGLPDAAPIDLVGAQVLDSKHKIFMVEVAEEVLLLGCGEKGVSLLRTVEKEKLNRNLELDFFAEGDRLDAEAAMADWQSPTRPAYTPTRSFEAPPPGSSNQAATQNMVDRLTREIEGRHQQVASAGAPIVSEEASEEAPEQLLDEEWAAGILKLRKRREDQAARDPLAIH
jgi:flagellar biogenesis protein FliO